MLSLAMVLLVSASAGALVYFTGPRTYKNDKKPGSAAMGALSALGAAAVGFFLDAWSATSAVLQWGLTSGNGGLVATSALLMVAIGWVGFNVTWSWAETGSLAS